VNDGEIAVASKEELHTAPLSGKQLLTLWSALPSAEKRRKVGNREGMIDELWSAIEALPDPDPKPEAKRPSKLPPKRSVAGSTLSVLIHTNSTTTARLA